MNLTWATFNNIRMLLMACMPIVIFYLIWLVNTSEGIRSEEGTLLDLVCWPDGNAIPVIIACGSIIAVVIEVIRFSSKTVDLKANDTYLRSISYNSLTQLGTLWKLNILCYTPYGVCGYPDNETNHERMIFFVLIYFLIFTKLSELSEKSG